MIGNQHYAEYLEKVQADAAELGKQTWTRRAYLSAPYRA